MTQPPSDQALLAAVARLSALPADCGRAADPGVDEVTEWQDFSGRETTNDQLRIEEVVAAERLGAGSALLHVGVGNSGLAERLHGQFRLIAGITIQKGEAARAQALGLAGYQVMLANKYSPDLCRTVAGPFAVIVDNNPTSFCCCRSHLVAMMQNYAELLAPGGVLLTDRKGLRWTTQPNDTGWGLALAEWDKIGAAFGLAPVRYTDFVTGLRKPG